MENTLERIEKGSFYYDLELLFKICEALEIKPYLIPLEEESKIVDLYS